MAVRYDGFMFSVIEKMQSICAVNSEVIFCKIILRKFPPYIKFLFLPNGITKVKGNRNDRIIIVNMYICPFVQLPFYVPHIK